jgi:photosynthetic reaction center H subunit
METGSITQYVDVAQLVLYLFWVFFFALVAYLTIEGKREGFPLESSDLRGGKGRQEIGLLPIPSPKVFRTKFMGDFTAPHSRDIIGEPIAGQPINKFPGAPIEPTGDEPMNDNIGPGSYTNRTDVPDLTVMGDFKIVPLRVTEGFSIDKDDIDPRGLEVKGFDKVSGGSCTDVWVDRSEDIIRYLELKTKTGKTVLLPFNFCKIKKDFISVESILGAQFEKVPTLKNQNTISLLEEEKVMAFYGAGTLMAYPKRREPIV